jgi:SHAQKYF class myb-like DNA-binding protein
MGDEHDHAASTNMGQPSSAQAMNPEYSHAGHGQQRLGHSTSPDLLKIYESLTQSNAHTQQHEPQYQQPPPPPASPHMFQQMYHNDFCPPAPAAIPYPLHPQQHNFAAQPPTEMADCEDTSSVATSNSGIRLKKRTVEKDEVEDDRSSSDGSISHSRKKRKSDGQSSKRLTWPDELHRDFVSAIFDVGLKHSSPSALLEFMPEHDEISSERVKSHLQKYRLHRVKSKKEFMSRFDTSLKNYQAFGIKSQSREVAPHLAYSRMTGPEEQTPSELLPAQADAIQDYAHEMIGTSPGGALILPKLTEAEKQSPLGASLGYMTGLFFALNQHLTASRAAAASVGTNAAAALLLLLV